MRGSRPGERRGGRQKGTPNRKTALTQAAIAARAANENLSPLDLMLAIMRDPHVALVTRVKMALRALPLLHTKLKAVPSGSSGLGHNGAAVPSSDGAKKSNSDSRKSAPATHGDAKAEAVNNRAAAPSADQPDDSHESSRRAQVTVMLTPSSAAVALQRKASIDRKNLRLTVATAHRRQPPRRALNIPT